jgi:hypothetical protein
MFLTRNKQVFLYQILGTIIPFPLQKVHIYIYKDTKSNRGELQISRGHHLFHIPQTKIFNKNYVYIFLRFVAT